MAPTAKPQHETEVTPTSRTVSCRLWLNRLSLARLGSKDGVDPEGVHLLRVATARLRVWLALGSRHALQKDLRWLRDRAADVRSLDVQLAKDPPHRLARRWRKRRAHAAARLVIALAGHRTAALVASLAVVPSLEPRDATRVTRALAIALSRASTDWTNVTATHALRRKVRRLRYALEWQHRSTRRLTALQAAMGEACDCAFALADARGHTRPVKRYRRELRHRREAALGAARRLWRGAAVEIEELAS